MFYIFTFFKVLSFVLDAGTSCALSLHLMLTSSTLPHSFDISVAIWAVRNLLAANEIGVRTIAFAQSDHINVLFKLSGWNFQHLSRIDWATKWCWQCFLAIFLHIYGDNYGSFWTKLCIFIILSLFFFLHYFFKQNIFISEILKKKINIKIGDYLGKYLESLTKFWSN